MMELQYNTVTTSHPRWNSVIRMLVRVLEDTLNFSFHIPIWCILVSIEFWTDTVLMNSWGQFLQWPKYNDTAPCSRQYSFNSRVPIWTSRGDGRAVVCKPTEMGTGFQYSEKKRVRISSIIITRLLREIFWLGLSSYYVCILSIKWKSHELVCLIAW